ncbi:MAG: serine/threonine-protein phosphatase [Lachnospiraceae bacterium]|nr:serine/threonine-protein phosphatase [Lachnospiraceae bacterium]
MRKNISIDLAYASVNHIGEELCGDNVEVVNNDDSRILILTDGMGSGVRANILATLTSRIIATMMRHKMSVDEVVSTIAKTLPISSVNGAAYSTFSMIQAFEDGRVFIVEYDNPECILIRNGKVEKLPFQYRNIEGKEIRECEFRSEIGDSFAIMSDGCLYCGTGDIMNYSWDWKALSKCAAKAAGRSRNAQQMADYMNNACKELYGNKPTDDTTVAVLRIQKEHILSILTGPPADKADDYRMVEAFMKTEGIKIVSGGSTSQMVARVLNKKLVHVEGEMDPEIPPMSKIEGVDLVTEGVLTIRKAIELLEGYIDNDVSDEFFMELSRDNGATRLACYLMEDCSTVKLFVGRAVNDDYDEKTLPFDISARRHLTQNLIDVLERMNKKAEIYYY